MADDRTAAVYHITKEGELDYLSLKEYQYVESQWKNLSIESAPVLVVLYWASRHLFFTPCKKTDAIRHLKSQRGGIRNTAILNPSDSTLFEFTLFLPEILLFFINSKRFQIRLVDWDSKAPLCPGILISDQLPQDQTSGDSANSLGSATHLLLPEALCYLRLRSSNALVFRPGEAQLLLLCKQALMDLSKETATEEFLKKTTDLVAETKSAEQWNTPSVSSHEVDPSVSLQSQLEPAWVITRRSEPEKTLLIYIFDDQLDAVPENRHFNQLLCRVHDRQRTSIEVHGGTLVAVVSCSENSVSFIHVDRVPRVDELRPTLK